MKIWYQSFSRVGVDPRWGNYERALRTHLAEVARPGTVVDLHGVERLHPKFNQYYYFLGLHTLQVVDNALKAERAGYDAFISGGMLDPGYFELKEVLDIPVAFLAESSYHVACMLAPKFTIVGAPGEVALRKIEERINLYELEQRWVPGVPLSPKTVLQQIEDFTENPQRVIDEVSESVRKPIEQGAEILVCWSGTLSTFFADKGVKEIGGVPVLDNVQIVVQIAELLADLKRSGISRSRRGLYGAPTKEEVIEARRVYGVE